MSVRRAASTAAWIVGTCVALAAAMLAGVLIGPVHLSPPEVVGSLLGHVAHIRIHTRLAGTNDAILWQIRAPRVVLAVLVGGALSVSGAAYQGVFRNPLVDPYLLGVAAGAGLGATFAIIGNWQQVAGIPAVPIAAFGGALAAVALAFVVGRPSRAQTHLVTSPITTLLLAGIAIGSFLTAIQTFVQQRHSQSLPEVYAWILGQLDSSGWSTVREVAPWALVPSIALFTCGRALDVLAVGDDEAASLGLHVRAVRLSVIALASAAAAAAVAGAGLIGFVGLVIPHCMRRLAGASYVRLLPLAFLAGGAFLVLADIGARTFDSPAEIPIGVVTAFLGAPFFAWLLRSARSPV